MKICCQWQHTTHSSSIIIIRKMVGEKGHRTTLWQKRNWFIVVVVASGGHCVRLIKVKVVSSVRVLHSSPKMCRCICMKTNYRQTESGALSRRTRLMSLHSGDDGHCVLKCAQYSNWWSFYLYLVVGQNSQLYCQLAVAVVTLRCSTDYIYTRAVWMTSNKRTKTQIKMNKFAELSVAMCV